MFQKLIDLLKESKTSRWLLAWAIVQLLKLVNIELGINEVIEFLLKVLELFTMVGGGTALRHAFRKNGKYDHEVEA